jgi:hypothetical protein
MSLTPGRPAKAWHWKLIGFLQIGNAIAFGAVASTVDFSRSAKVEEIAVTSPDSATAEVDDSITGDDPIAYNGVTPDKTTPTPMPSFAEDATAPLSELVARATQDSTGNPAGSDLPEVVLSAPTIVNAATNTATVRFVVNGEMVELKPGQRRTLSGGDSWVVRFHRGGEFGAAYEPIYDGTHEFVVGPRGWNLERTADRP